MEGKPEVKNHDNLLSEELPLEPNKTDSDPKDFGSAAGSKKGQDTQGGDMPRNTGVKTLDELLNSPPAPSSGGGRRSSRRRSRRRSKRRRSNRRRSKRRRRRGSSRRRRRTTKRKRYSKRR